MPRYKITKTYEATIEARSESEAERNADELFMSDPSSYLSDYETIRLSNQTTVHQVVEALQIQFIPAQVVHENHAVIPWVSIGKVEDKDGDARDAFTLYEFLDDETGETRGKGWFLQTGECEECAEFGDLPLNELIAQITLAMSRHYLNSDH